MYIPNINSSTITYRNAIYEGQINNQNQNRNDFGIIYVAKTHEFICCNNWHNDNLEGECLFFNDHKQYIYGTWIGNLPQGFNVFRFDEVLFMAEFNRGKLPRNSKVLVIFEKYNLAAILLVLNDSDNLDDLQLQVYSKLQVFSPQDVNTLFTECRWPHEYFIQNQTLIKYISHKLTRSPARYEHPSKNQQPKLRLIENKYYRFGYDEGLAIVFDEDFSRISVGCHSKNKLNSFGIIFDQKPKPLALYNKPQQGKIIKIQSQNTILKTALKNEVQKSENPQQIKYLKTNLLMGVNFCNKFFKNPSKIFAYYIQNIVSQESIKKIIAGSLTTRRMYEQSLDFSKIQQNNQISSDLLQKDFKKPNIIAPITHENQQVSRTDTEKLTGDRLRLQAIKKQIYDSLEKRKQVAQQMLATENYSREFINKEMVGYSHYNDHLQTPQRTNKSKSRRRIFEESEKNLKLLRDFTPTRSEPNLTPFKTKMKNRIFHGEESKNSMSREKNQSYESYGQNRQKHNRKQIFQNEEAESSNAIHFNEQNHPSNNFSTKKSNANEPRSKGKIRDLRNRDLNIPNQEQKVSFGTDNARYVIFEERISAKDSFPQNHNSKQTFESGKSPQYVPINSFEQKQRKRSIQNPPSYKESRGSNAEESKSPKHFSRQNEFQNSRPETQKQLTPKSKYYLEEKSSRHQESRSFNYQNDSRKQQTLSPQNLDKGYRVQYNKEKREHQNQRRAEANFIYQDDTFKQTTLPEEFDSNKFREKERDFEERQRQPAFKHSNEVYLEELKKKNSPIKSIQTQGQGYYGYNRRQNPANRTVPYMLGLENQSKSKDNYNMSYRVKHKMKKSMEKEISRSPDRIRCYGKNLNNPYIENSPKYSKQGSYMMSYNKYESPQLMSKKDNYLLGPMGRNPRTKLF